MSPIVGRTFSTVEQQQGVESRVALISHHAWQTWFGGDSEITGRSLMINGRSFSIIGLTLDEVAEVLGTSPATVSRSWASARAWLYGELDANSETDREHR